MKEIISKIIKNKLYLLLFIFLFVLLFSIYGIKGIYSRYAQDDYCYGFRVKTFGFWKMQFISYFEKTNYNSDRFSLTLAHSIAETLGGPKFVPVLPTLEMVIWSVSLCYLIYQLLGIKDSRQRALIAAVSALGILFFTLYLTNNLYEILFWLSGMQTYLTPMVVITVTLGRLAAMTRSTSLKTRFFIEIAILCLIAGGFSETTTLWFFVCLYLIIILMMIFGKRLPETRTRSKLIFTAIIATGIALFIMAVNPITSAPNPQHLRPDFETLLRMSLYYGEEFIRVNLKGTPLPYLAVGGLGFWLGSLVMPRQRHKTRSYLLGMLITLVILYVLSVIVMVPYMYVFSAYPGERSLLPAKFSLILSIFITGWLCSGLFYNLWPGIKESMFFKISLSIIGVLLFAYLARTAPRVYDKLPAYQERAEAWDLRQKLILDEKAAGVENVIAPAFDSIYGITELHYEANNWVNQCAAKYYGVQTISTIDNYAGISAHPIGK